MTEQGLGVEENLSTGMRVMYTKATPLATRMRPDNIEDVVGQEDILGPGSILGKALDTGRLFSMLFWGPPGSGKTTIARLVAQYTESPFETFSAVISGLKELREIISTAKKNYRDTLKPTILFVDEIHRFNKAQQDAFLPHVESGLIILIGATTQNPSFEIIPPLLSRVRVMTLKPIGHDCMKIVLNRAVKDKARGLGHMNIRMDEDALNYIIAISQGDARSALNALEAAVYFAQPNSKNERILSASTVARSLDKKPLSYDKNGEEHYNLISALHKSMRGGDPQASVYWLYRMLEAGEDPLFIGRRLIRFASEDVGLADPKALELALAAYNAWERVGPPEAKLSLAQAVIYLSLAPKSNAVYLAEKSVKKEIEASGQQPVPLHLRNAPTKMMRDMGYSKGYIYPHDYPDGEVRQEYLPENIRGKIFYKPSNKGFEADIKKMMSQKRYVGKKNILAKENESS